MNTNARTQSVKPTSKTVTEHFENCLMELYKKFNSPVSVTVISEYPQNGSTSQRTRGFTTKHKHVSVARLATVISASCSESTIAVKDEGISDIILPITAMYDAQNRLSALLMVNFREVIMPRETIQLLALILPNYQQLFKFTIKNCRIDQYVVHELGKMLPYTTITDVCLDDCPLKQAKYEELLENTTNLKNLSLCRCKINDDVCERMASKLHYPESAEKSLITLNLSSNCIGDEGAKYFANALRSNRHLRYLNLADNHITDEGAIPIFNMLKEFPLTSEEDVNRRRRFMIYLRKKNEIFQECLHKLSPPLKSPAGSILSNDNKTQTHDKVNVRLPPKKVGQRKPKLTKKDSVYSTTCTLSEDYLLSKAELIAIESVGPFVDPFCPNSLTNEDNTHCIGNFVLCYLNLAYNDLSYVSVSKLLAVVEHQTVHCEPGVCGLMKVILDGNYLPVACTEMMTIQNLLNQHIDSFKSKKSRT